jgi:hypothetical protein
VGVSETIGGEEGIQASIVRGILLLVSFFFAVVLLRIMVLVVVRLRDYLA